VRSLWPSGDLAAAIGPHKPLYPPSGILARIEAFSSNEGAVVAVLDLVDQQVPTAYKDDCVSAVVKRGKEIASLSEEVWSQS
jgi:hypothetical protein